MLWILRDLDLLSELARAFLLSFEILALGGALYLLFVSTSAAGSAANRACRRAISVAAIALALSEAAELGISSAELMTSSAMNVVQLLHQQFFVAGLAAIGAAVALSVAAVWMRGSTMAARAVLVSLGLVLVATSVATSHAAASLNHRVFLAAATAAHHIGAAAWLGAMPFLLISLKRVSSRGEALDAARRFSRMALAAAAVLAIGGIGMSRFYVGSLNGLYGTSYGVLLSAKIYLFVAMAVLGAGNWYMTHRMKREPDVVLTHVRRFAEVEIGLGFIAVLAAASLTAQSPAVDVAAQYRVTPREIYAHIRPEVPRMTTPAAASLTPATPMAVAIRVSEFQPSAPDDANDRAWSNYNHHWAGVIVLVAAILAGLSRFQRMRWARYWPISFAGLAIFIVLRADPENWPLGPRPFWESFSAPDVLEHRAAAALILAFAIFECAVQANKLRVRWAGKIFPAMCILGASILLIHDHAAQNTTQELFDQISHVPIALMGLSAGWGRWLELRTPESRAGRFAGYCWPICLAIAGLILLNFREA